MVGWPWQFLGKIHDKKKDIYDSSNKEKEVSERDFLTERQSKRSINGERASKFLERIPDRKKGIFNSSNGETEVSEKDFWTERESKRSINGGREREREKERGVILRKVTW